MEVQKEFRLSSYWSSFTLVLNLILLSVFIPVFVFVVTHQEFHLGIIFAGVILIALIGFIIYLAMYVCNAWIIGDKIVLKKQLRSSKSYSFDKIVSVRSFQLKRTKFTRVMMRNENDSTEMYLIANSRSLLSFENRDTESLLRGLINSERKVDK